MTDPNVARTARLDAFAAQIATQRPQVPQYAEFEEQLVTQFAEFAPDGVEQRAAGAAWLIAANLLGPLAQQPAAMALDLLRLAGQRLYAGGDVRQSMPCPFVYDTGTQCRHVAKGTSPAQLDAWMATHYGTYHSHVPWPPTPRDEVGAWLAEVAPAAKLTEAPPEDARGVVGICRMCAAPIWAVGDDGEIQGRLTTDGAYCEPCYAKESALPDDEGDELVHMWARDENDNPTGYALCDTGDGAYTPGGKIANGAWQVICPKCEQIRDEGAPEPADSDAQP